MNKKYKEKILKTRLKDFLIGEAICVADGILYIINN